MSDSEQSYLRDVQYRFPDRLKARSILHTRYGRGDWFEWLALTFRYRQALSSPTWGAVRIVLDERTAKCAIRPEAAPI